MIMERLISYLPILLAATLSSQSAFADRGNVQANGLFIVRGAAMDRAIVRVVPTGAKAYSLPLGTERFILDLPLNDTYLVSFERPGCPTKELYFDTSVPVEQHAEGFEFRFKVILQHVEKERMFSYEGPVGFVRYMHQLKDFGYETNYVVKVDEKLKERMEGYKVTGVDPQGELPPMAALVVDRNLDGSSMEPLPSTAPIAIGDIAPIVREVSPMVHRLGTPEEAIEEPEVGGPTASRGDFLPMMEAAAIKELPLEPAVLVIPTVITPKDEVADTMSAVPLSTAIAASKQREEELIVEPRWVSKVVRVTHPNGRVEEFRKVEHSYGATFFFHNGQSITADRYNFLSAQL